MNAFFIMLLVMCIFAILAVDLFREVGKGGKITFETQTMDDYFTARGGWYGKEYFGNFFKSLYTLFQVLTGESWSEAIARPLIEGWSPVGAGIFFVTFILLNAVVLINVVVAVLLEKMVDDQDDEHDEPGEEDCGEGSAIVSKAANANASSQIAELKMEMAKLQETMALLLARLEGMPNMPLPESQLASAPVPEASRDAPADVVEEQEVEVE